MYLSDSNSWFLEMLNGFPAEGLPFFKLIFFLKIKKCFNLTKKFDISCAKSLGNVRELDPPLPTNSHQFDANCGKIWYVRERPFTRNFFKSSQLSNHKTNEKQLGKLKCNKNQKFNS